MSYVCSILSYCLSIACRESEAVEHVYSLCVCAWIRSVRYIMIQRISALVPNVGYAQYIAILLCFPFIYAAHQFSSFTESQKNSLKKQLKVRNSCVMHSVTTLVHFMPAHVISPGPRTESAKRIPCV